MAISGRRVRAILFGQKRQPSLKEKNLPCIMKEWSFSSAWVRLHEGTYARQQAACLHSVSDDTDGSGFQDATLLDESDLWI